MIAHLAPRRVSVTGHGGKDQAGFPVDLDRILGVDLQAAPGGRATMTLRFTNGEQVVAASYARMDEAGRDCGKLRVLAGLPAWAGVEHAAEDTPAPDRLLAAPMALAAFTLLIVTGLSGVFTPALLLLTTATTG